MMTTQRPDDDSPLHFMILAKGYDDALAGYYDLL